MGNWILIPPLLFCCTITFLWCTRASPFSNLPSQDLADGTHSQNPQQYSHLADEIHCSRERSRAAWKVVDEYLMPFVEKEKYQISRKCKLHPDNDMFRDQELHKLHHDVNDWKCGYCKKSFYAEKYLDKHFDNRHYNLLNISKGNCLADLCGALHCDLVMDSQSRKTKCNPAAAVKNRHLCEKVADNCFPVSGGPSASRLHEFFLRQFCDAHSCSGETYQHFLYRCFCFDPSIVAAVLWLCIYVQEGFEDEYARSETSFAKQTEEEALLVGYFRKQREVRIGFGLVFWTYKCQMPKVEMVFTCDTIKVKASIRVLLKGR
ncbi:hypothetical protein KSS87_007706 [Heliosperma pusillum]|nr:hypothetical protein KSS87_007706 [Heliosperma pusillum]